jgi:hypothetical protein
MKKTRGSYVLEGFGAFSVPLHIARLDNPASDLHGWQVRPPNTDSKFFTDGAPRDPAGALERARTYLLACGVKPRSRRPLPPAERDYKQNRTGVVGVYLQRRQRIRKGRDTVSYSFLIPRPDKSGPCRTVYIGSESTWQSNYEQKLCMAREIRRDFEEQFELAAISQV